MGQGSEQDETIRFLSDPHSYGPGIDAVERHETHGAIVFLAGDRAYKLKRAVKFSYMDYSTVERRRHMCMRELSVNRRMAPMIYLGVCPIVKDGPVLRFGSEAEHEQAADWVVVMHRFDQDALLESMRRSGSLSTRLIRLVAETIALFHAGAEARPDFGGEAALRAVVADTTAILKSRVGRPFHKASVEQYERTAPRILARVAALLDERRATGHVRRCHGDLHLNNIFVREGRPVLFDAIEFEDRYIYIDVLYDLAFLLMDLDRHGLRGHANTVLNRYLECSDEYAGLAAIPLFLSCRAAIRAHTTVSAAEAIPESDRRQRLREEACALLDKAVGYLAEPAPRLIAVGGLSGTGKTTLANGLAPLLGACPGAVVIRSDVIRKHLSGVADTVRLPQTAYTPSVTTRVYDRIADIASNAMASGFTVIADAVYGKESERQAIGDIARRAGVRFDGLWLEGPAALLEERIAARVGDASDATPGVLRAQLGFVAAPQDWRPIRVEGRVDETLAAARQVLGC